MRYIYSRTNDFQCIKHKYLSPQLPVTFIFSLLKEINKIGSGFICNEIIIL
jgi:hypothetical protein